MKRKRRHRLRGVFIILFCAVAALFAFDAATEGNILGRIKTKASLVLSPIDKDAVSTDDDAWQLILVNGENPLPDDFSVELTPLSNGHKVDSRVYPYLQKMFDDARSQGILPAISSSYRTGEEQQAELDQKTREFENQGYAPDEALEIAKTWAALPGTSEHQTGLALDITTADAKLQSADIVWNWLRKNSYKYGFIVRYPANKVDITGISNEPWHFRYVGQSAAEEIYRHGLCLEEYLDLIHKKRR